jgi:endogenous inhibitor of DNA gyrase (YacG/DUF329 family)
MIVNCPKCGKEFENKAKSWTRTFCSRKCSNSRGPRSPEVKEKIREAVNSFYKKENRSQDDSPREPAVCPECGKHYFVSLARKLRQVHCSLQCGVDSRKKLRTKKILAGEYRTHRGLKTFLIEKEGNVCKDCGNTGTHNGKPLVLQLDHIDGDPDNNFPENLRLLCPNCHTQTPTYSGGSKKKNKQKTDERNKKFREWYKNKTT